MKKHPLLWFYLLAFLISWVGWAPSVAASRGVTAFAHPAFQALLLFPALGPAIAAVVVTWAAEGRGSVLALMTRLVRWRVGGLWYVAALLIPPLLHLSARGVDRVLGINPPSASDVALTGPALVGFVIVSLLSNPWEEVGWRGFALPRLQSRSNALVATLIVGFLWGMWHLPLFWWAGGPMAAHPFVPWLVGVIGESFVYTWLYNGTGGSLLVVSLYHVVGNVSGALLADKAGSAVGMAVAAALLAIVLVLVFGPARLSRRWEESG